MSHSVEPRPARAIASGLLAKIALPLVLVCCVFAGGQTAQRSAAPVDAATLPEAPQPQTAQSDQNAITDPVTLRDTPMHILRDQGAIWSSPARLTGDDMKILVPLSIATAAAIATDTRAMTQVVPIDASLNSHSVDASNVLTGGFIAAPIALYGLGHFKQDPLAAEAGILTGEAMIDSVVVEQGMKLIFWRERPNIDGARGHFFASDATIDSSFPSSHCVVVWSAASVLAGEYHSRWIRLLLYTAAASVSATRVLGQQHFPSDVLVGSAAGWLVGHHVFRVHHRFVSKNDEDY